MNDRLAAAYEVCLQALLTGASLEDCLRLYPDLTEELRPPLQAATLLQQPSLPPSPAAMARSRNRILARAAQVRSQRRQSVLRKPLLRLAFGLAVLLVAFTAGWGGLTTAAAQALPGETLYRVKRAQETLRLQLVRDDPSRQQLRLVFNERREDEARQLLRLGRKGEVSFEGVVEAQGSDHWTVSGLPVGLTDATALDEQIKPGDLVVVLGTTRSQGDILASSIRLRTYQLIGPVQQQSPGQWTIAGQALDLLPTTQVQTGIQPGDVVLALVEVEPNGQHVALVILSMTAESSDGSQGTPPPAGSTPATSEFGDDKAETVDFTGVLEQQQGLTWMVDGRTLRQTSESEIRGEIQLGDRVRVRGQLGVGGEWILLRIERADGDLDGDDAGTPDPDDDDDDELPEGSNTPSPPDDGDGDDDTDEPPDDEPEELSFTGTIASISSSQWVVDGRTLHITGESQVDDDLEVGDEARSGRCASRTGIWRLSGSRRPTDCTHSRVSYEPAGVDLGAIVPRSSFSRRLPFHPSYPPCTSRSTLVSGKDEAPTAPNRSRTSSPCEP